MERNPHTYIDGVHCMAVDTSLHTLILFTDCLLMEATPSTLFFCIDNDDDNMIKMTSTFVTVSRTKYFLPKKQIFIHCNVMMMITIMIMKMMSIFLIHGDSNKVYITGSRTLYWLPKEKDSLLIELSSVPQVPTLTGYITFCDCL